jgi:hypothetical protein
MATGQAANLRSRRQVVIIVGGGPTSVRSPVPSLFRLTLIGATKRCEPTSSEAKAQEHYRRYRGHRRKFELYFDAYRSRKLAARQATRAKPCSSCTKSALSACGRARYVFRPGLPRAFSQQPLPGSAPQRGMCARAVRSGPAARCSLHPAPPSEDDTTPSRGPAALVRYKISRGHIGGRSRRDLPRTVENQ